MNRNSHIPFACRWILFDHLKTPFLDPILVVAFACCGCSSLHIFILHPTNCQEDDLYALFRLWNISLSKLIATAVFIWYQFCNYEWRSLPILFFFPRRSSNGSLGVELYDKQTSKNINTLLLTKEYFLRTSEKVTRPWNMQEAMKSNAEIKYFTPG